MSSLHTPRGGDVPPATAPRRARTRTTEYQVRVHWADITVEHLDLDQFDDDGNLRSRHYRRPSAQAAPEGGAA